MKGQRFYNFLVELYPEQMDILNNIFNTYECIYILHDKDVKESGEEVEPHYHIVVKLQNAKTISALAKEFDIREERIEPVKKGLTRILKYLIHNGCEDKYQYDISEVKYNSISLYKKLEKSIIDDTDENEKVNDLIDYINESDKFIYFNTFAKYVCSIGKWEVLRRNQYIFIRLIEEHNSFVSNN